ncbi:LysR family transcriptional regulator [Bifidobacterium sp. DSM 109958]|uniref:LysR family transcriptional regulator n=1 Tax=Bifidobacterium moraviense TaxID=2675323 RepID=A0A7Y0I023_9BIFI|nr:LysR family transcriptional regulator [Bifidobacterium sp. DSM 109958]NMN00998.1 LysR family transcriptional regulator [Bifidobacterium sp. DSM 109958]
MEELSAQSLLTLWQIGRSGSFSAAARTLGWSQPAISQQITRLEKQTGMTLVRRTSHGVELTDAGAMLARHGGMIAERLGRASHELEDLRRRRLSRLRVLAPPSICSTIVARAMVGLGRDGDIEVNVDQAEPPEAVERVRSGKADLAVVFEHRSLPHSLPLDEGLAWEPLGDDPLLLLVRRADAGRTDACRADVRDGAVPAGAAAPAAPAAPADLADWADAAWIAGCDTCKANLLAMASAAGFTPDIRHATDDYWTTQTLVEMGVGVSIVPALDTVNQLRPSLAALPLADPRAVRVIGVLTRAGDDRPAVAAFRASLARTAARVLRAPAAD